MVDLYVKNNALVEDKDRTGGYTATQLWESGRLGINYTSIWNHRAWSQKLQFDWDQAVTPQNKQRATVVSSSAYIVSQASTHPAEAWELVKHINSVREIVLHHLTERAK